MYWKVNFSLARRVAAEAIGTALLLAAVIGSAALTALILTFGPISGAHFNPAVSLADASQGGLAWRDVPLYVLAQTCGAFAGVAAAHFMFGLPLFTASHHVRAGAAQTFSEFIATFGLLSVIWGCVRFRSQAVPIAVAAYITAAYWFTSSSSFANPAVTLARSMSDTFVGIRLADAPAFIVAQLGGAAVATILFRWLIPSLANDAGAVIMQHGDNNE